MELPKIYYQLKVIKRILLKGKKSKDPEYKKDRAMRIRAINEALRQILTDHNVDVEQNKKLATAETFLK